MPSMILSALASWLRAVTDCWVSATRIEALPAAWVCVLASGVMASLKESVFSIEE